MTFIFKRFELDDLLPNSSILIIGDQNSNKNKIVKDIIINYKKNCVVIGNDKLHLYKTKELEKYVKYQEGCNGKVIDQYLGHNIESKKNSSYFRSCCKKLIVYCCLLEIEKDEQYKVDDKMLILDDCLDNHPSSKNINILTETTSGLIMTFSSINHCFLDPKYSIYYDYIFLLHDPYTEKSKESEEKLKIMYEKYCNMIPEYGLFKTTFLDICRDECAMVIVKNGTEELTTKIFWFPMNKIKKEL